MSAPNVPISREAFAAYESVRRTKDIDLLNYPVIGHLTGLTPQEIVTIQSQYNSLRNTYYDVIEELDYEL